MLKLALCLIIICGYCSVSAKTTTAGKTTAGSKEKATTVTTGKPTTSGPRKLYKCTTCIGKGNDCKGAQQANCLYCMKIIGVVQGDPKDKVTQAFVNLLFPGIKASGYIGKEVTVKKCVTKLDLTTFNYPDKEGCGDVDDFSVKGYGCVCKDECKEPMSAKQPTTTGATTSSGGTTSKPTSGATSPTKKP